MASKMIRVSGAAVPAAAPGSARDAIRPSLHHAGGASAAARARGLRCNAVLEAAHPYVADQSAGPLEAVTPPPFTEEQLRNPGKSRSESVVPYTFIEGPDAWYAQDQLARQHEWLHELTAEQVSELERAVEGVLASGLVRLEGDGKYLNVSFEATPADFPLPTLGPLLTKMVEEARWGRGFQILRGLPVDRWTRVQSMAAYWGIGLYWGKMQHQNQKGHLIGHVKEVGIDPTNSKGTTRLYMTRMAQPWHVDASDLVALLCLKTAKSGGMSGWASSTTIYNEILRRRPDLIPVMSGTWYMDRKKEVPPGKRPYFVLPIFIWFKNRLTVSWNDTYYQLPPKLYPDEVPALTKQQLEAIDLFNEIAYSPEINITMWLKPGDLQLLGNHNVVHNRTQFEDHEHVDDKRHLLRLWLSSDQERPLPPYFSELWGSVTPGARGGVGFKCGPEGGCIPLEAEVGQLQV